MIGDIGKAGRYAYKGAKLIDAADTGRDITKVAKGLDAVDLGKDITDVKVIGRTWDTDVAKEWPGHDVLDITDWTKEKNMAWVDGGIVNKQNFYIASPEAGNMIHTSGPFKGQPTVYAQEIKRLKDAGYVKIGDYYVHPDNVATFIHTHPNNVVIFIP